MSAFANTPFAKLLASRGLSLSSLSLRCGYHDGSTIRSAVGGNNGIAPSAVIPLAMELGLVTAAPITPANVRALYRAAAAALDQYMPIPPLAPGFLGLELLLGRRRTSSQVAERLVAAELRIIAGDMIAAKQFARLSRWSQRTPDELREYVENCTEWNVAHQGIVSVRRNAIAMHGQMWRAWIADEHAARRAALVAWRKRHGMVGRNWSKRKDAEPAVTPDAPVVEPAAPVVTAVKPATATAPAPSRAHVVTPRVAAPVTAPVVAPVAPVAARARSVWTPDLDRPRPALVEVDPTVRGKGVGKVAPKPVPVTDPDDAPIVVDDELRNLLFGGVA